jgi:hypothetical protein
MIQPPTKMPDTGRWGALGHKFNQLLAFARSLQLVKSRTIDITRTPAGTSLEIKSSQNIITQKVGSGGGDSVWS